MHHVLPSECSAYELHQTNLDCPNSGFDMIRVFLMDWPHYLLNQWRYQRDGRKEKAVAVGTIILTYQVLFSPQTFSLGNLKDAA